MVSMTIEEFSNIPSNMSFEDYSKLIEIKHKLHKKIKTLNDRIIREEDYISVLTDEYDTIARIKHQTKLSKYQRQRDEYLCELADVNKQLGVNNE